MNKSCFTEINFLVLFVIILEVATATKYSRSKVHKFRNMGLNDNATEVKGQEMGNGLVENNNDELMHQNVVDIREISKYFNFLEGSFNYQNSRYPKNRSPFKHINHDHGELVFSIEIRKEELELCFILYDGRFADNSLAMKNTSSINLFPTNLNNITFLDMNTVYTQTNKYVQHNNHKECLANMSIISNLVNNETLSQFTLESNICNFSIFGELHSPNIELNLYRWNIYYIFVIIMSSLNILVTLIFLRMIILQLIMENDLQNFSKIFLSFNILWNICLFIIHSQFPLTKLKSFALLSLLLLPLNQIFQIALIFIYQNKSLSENNVIKYRSKYKLFWLQLCIFFIVGIVTITYLAFCKNINYIALFVGILLLPQIFRNCLYLNAKIPPMNYLILVSLQHISSILYFTVYKSNGLRIRPNYLLCAYILGSVSICLLIIYSQGKFGCPFFLPKGLLGQNNEFQISPDARIQTTQLTEILEEDEDKEDIQ